ncbi:hypothetical protein RNZ50_12690 [Paracoccaceae bacterium Fryx2]|nr:hypothetical protein [Paracoccaceae bacterium Fryx2]
MKSLIETLLTAARNRTRYRRTRYALARLPLDTRLDLDIYEGDIDRIARKAVWG